MKPCIMCARIKVAVTMVGSTESKNYALTVTCGHLNLQWETLQMNLIIPVQAHADN